MTTPAGTFYPVTDLDNMRARDYNPATSTFTSVDPMLANTGQPYGYAGSDPVGLSNPPARWSRPAAGVP
jgi:RHS repeat-associated protein